MIQLHPYQATDIESIRAWFRKRVRCVLWYMPTGAGKSYASGFMFLSAASAGKICWFIVHRRELIRQTERLFKSLGIDFAIVAAGYPMQPHKKVQICSIGSLARRFDKLPKPDFACFDEVHHVAAATWTDIFKRLGDSFIVGLSASPARCDGRGLGPYFGALVATT